MDRRHNHASRRFAIRRGFSALETLVAVGVTLPLAIGLFFLGRAACGRLFQIIESCVSWPGL